MKLRALNVALVLAMALALMASPAQAQQMQPQSQQPEVQNRLWQGMEQQQSLRRNTPAPLNEGAGQSSDTSMAAMARFAALMQAPDERLQQQQLAVLNADNQRDWFGADRLLRQYERMPQYAPVLSTFVAASRSAASGDLGAAVTGYQDVLRADPRFTRATLDMARTLYADNRVRDAQDAFDRLRTQPLPPEVLRHIDEYRQAIDRREQVQGSLTISAVREDNVNSVSTVVDPCALMLEGLCLANTAGEKIAATGVYLEAAASKLWALSGHHGVLLRGLAYGNHYFGREDYDNLIVAAYGGYQYATARNQLQLLPLVEADVEGGREIYRAFGVRAAFTRQLSERAQLEASVEYKARNFAPRFAENLEGDFRSVSLFGQYVLPRGWLLFGHLMWRDSGARSPVFAYREQALRIGVHKSFEVATLSVVYGRREKRAEAANALFGRLQRDHEDSLFLSASAPGAHWAGWTPTLSYEYRNNRSSIAHAYNYEKNRLTLGVNTTF